MNPQPSLQYAEAYINVHLSRSGPGFHGRPPGPFVTVSRESGSGGSLFAAALATRLESISPGDRPWTVFDRNLVETVLRSQHLSPRLAKFMPEDKVSEIDASMGEIFGLHPSLWELTQRTNTMMKQLARSGCVVLVGRGANFATAEIPNGLHLRLVAPAEFRADRVARERELSKHAARAFNVRTDAARRKYVRAVFDADVAACSAYDFTINVATVTYEQAAELAGNLLRIRQEVTA